MSVYVVDDNNEARSALVAVFERVEGWTVVGSSGSAAMAEAEILRLAPAVAVLDAFLADGDGIRLCRTVKALLPDTKCVVVTAGIRPGYGPVEAAEAGADAFLVKNIANFPLVDVAQHLVSACATDP